MISGAIFHKSQFLTDDQLHEKINTCFFCGNQRFVSQGYLQRTPDVELLKCCHCKAATASRVPKDEVLEKYYRSYYNDGTEEKVTFDNTTKFATHLLKHAELSGDILNILDYGGGDGSLSYKVAEMLLKSGKTMCVNVVVIDYSPALIKSTHPSISISKLTGLKSIDSKYNLVIASAIIEHLPNPTSDFYRLFEVVADHGYFYARTPFMLPFFRAFKSLGLNFDLTYPAHIHDLGDGFWNTTPGLIEKKTGKKFTMIRSTPSIVETQFTQHPARTLLSYLFKLPWLFTKRYKFVGGWEIFLRYDS